MGLADGGSILPLASFKVWNAATVGGNICMSLPLISLTAFAGSHATWPREREAPNVAGRSCHRQPRRMSSNPARCCAPSTCRHGARQRFAFAARRSRIWDARRLSSSARNALPATIRAHHHGGDLKPIPLRFDRVPTPGRRKAICAPFPTRTTSTTSRSGVYKPHLTYYFASRSAPNS